MAEPTLRRSSQLRLLGHKASTSAYQLKVEVHRHQPRKRARLGNKTQHGLKSTVESRELPIDIVVEVLLFL
jgi:hypothetical protein